MVVDGNASMAANAASPPVASLPYDALVDLLRDRQRTRCSEQMACEALLSWAVANERHEQARTPLLIGITCAITPSPPPRAALHRTAAPCCCPNN